MISPSSSRLSSILWILLGSLLAACAVEFFFIPNSLIDGGILGVALTISSVIGNRWFPYFALFLHLPFFYLAYRAISRLFLLYMGWALLCFSLFCFLLHNRFLLTPSDLLETVVIGGGLLGTGVGIIIRMGGSLDGTEIVAILLNRRSTFTIGQIIFFFNLFIFTLFAIVSGNIHSALQSLIAYLIAVKVIDTIVLGSDEMKSLMVISSRSSELSDLLMDKLGLGLTIFYGRRGFSGCEQEILYVVVERLQLAEVKELIYQKDPQAFLSIQTLHEVIRERASLPVAQKEHSPG